MTTITPASFIASTSGNPITWDAPSGVRPDMSGLIVFTNATGTEPILTLTCSAGTCEEVDNHDAGNMWVNVWKVTGVTAGDTFSATAAGVQGAHQIQEIYQDEIDYTVASRVSGHRPSSSASCTSPAITPDRAGQTVVVISCERTLAGPTTLSSITSDGGETITQDVFATDTGSMDQTTYLGRFDAVDTDAHTVTATYSSGSGNGYVALILAEPIGVPAIIGTATQYTSGVASTSFTIDKPTGVQDGEALIVAVSGQSPTMTSDFTSSGWSRISYPYTAADPSRRVVARFLAVRGGGRGAARGRVLRAAGAGRGRAHRYGLHFHEHGLSDRRPDCRRVLPGAVRRPR